jgi:NADPH:quinone reductase-like Zn-dependent oxidoreductase
MSKNASLHGVSVGPRRLFEEMNQVIAANRIKPLIDRVFSFDEVHEAFRYHTSAKFIGKIVITI